jgi:uncharacterized protein (DUF1778 family)
MYIPRMYDLHMAAKSNEAKMARINMRISQKSLDLLREAAQANEQDLTSFVLGAAMEKARNLPGVNDRIYVSREVFDRLIADDEQAK